MPSLILAPALIPAARRGPLEDAVLESIASSHDPETFLWIVIPQPDGGARIRHAWTDEGAPLGDRIDRLALSLGLDAADWLHITDRHSQISHRGRIRIDAHPLRAIHADVQHAVRAPEDHRAGIRRLIERAHDAPRPGIPRWLGVGPALLAQTSR
ncbi:hypothetical protein ACIQMP_07990 [Streptomyces sp. NPDC091385]|uniref:hypothetical protein n=1 Tax=Streptomyces sp. NPDC091385 TaxID=3365997 RepID=UPI0037F82357